MGEQQRVLQLLGPSTGGIRRHVIALADELRARGWIVDVAGPAGVLDGLGDLDYAVPVGRVTALPRAVPRLRALGRRYDIVHAHGLTAGWTAALARRRGVPVVVSVHNVVLDEAEGWLAPAWRVLERRLPSRVDAVIAVSPSIASYLAAPNVTVISAFGPQPTPQRTPPRVRSALAVSADANLVVCVARLHPQKGLDVLIDALPQVRAAVADIHVALVGEGPLEHELRQRVAAEGLADVVTFAPPVNPADELAAADVVVIPSRWESGPLVLLEAAALGRAIVASDVGFVGDVIDDDSGWIVAPNDRDALARALIDALSRPDERVRRAAKATARAAPLLDRASRIDLVETVYRASLGDS